MRGLKSWKINVQTVRNHETSESCNSLQKKRSQKELAWETGVFTAGQGPNFNLGNPDLNQVQVQNDLTTLKSLGAGKSRFKEFSISGKPAVVLGGGGFKLLSFFIEAKGQDSGDPQAKQTQELKSECVLPPRPGPAVRVSGSWIPASSPPSCSHMSLPTSASSPGPLAEAQ